MGGKVVVHLRIMHAYIWEVIHDSKEIPVNELLKKVNKKIPWYRFWQRYSMLRLLDALSRMEDARMVEIYYITGMRRGKEYLLPNPLVRKL